MTKTEEIKIWCKTKIWYHQIL